MPDVLVAPAYRWCPPYTKTFGPEVVDLAASFGLILDGSQALCLDDMFSVRPGTASDGNLIEDATVCDRQNLKTVALQAAASAKLALFGDELVVWTAHEYPTAQEAFRDIKPWFTDFDHMSRLVKQVYEGKGDESIELMSGARMIFRARTKHGGRGISGDTVILDEAQKLTASNMGALVPTISSRQRSQLLYGGTAGDSMAAVWRRIRDRGRLGGQPRLGYREWCAPRVDCATSDCLHVDREGCALDRMDLWQAANPSLGLPGRLRIEVIQTERQTLPPAEFMRERLGWWEDPPVGGGVIDLDLWASLSRPDIEMAEPVAFSLEVALGRSSACIGAAWQGPECPHAALAEQRPGTEWVVEWLSAACSKRENRGVTLDGGTEALSLAPALEAAGVKVTVLKGSDRPAVCAGLFDRVTQSALTHDGQGSVAAALAGAAWRTTQEGARAFARKGGTDISPLYAISLALHGLTPPPAPLEPFCIVT